MQIVFRNAPLLVGLVSILIGLELVFHPNQLELSSVTKEKSCSDSISEGLSEPNRQAKPRKAETFVLFNRDGKFAPNYAKILKLLENPVPGDKVVLPSGKKFKILAYLGGMLSNAIFDIGDGWVLRVPAGDGKVPQGSQWAPTKHDYFGQNRSFVRIQKDLKANGMVDVVEIDEDRSELPYAVVVSKIDLKMRGDEFIEYFNNPQTSSIKLSNEEARRAEEALYTFLDQTWPYSSIGDFRTDQFGYDGKKWILFDVGDGNGNSHRHIGSLRDVNIVLGTAPAIDGEPGEEDRWWPKAIEAKATQRILAIRRHMASTRSWFQRPASHIEQSLIYRLTPSPLLAGWKVTYKNLNGDGIIALDEWSYHGYVPAPRRRVTIEIDHLIENKDNIATYQVVVSGQHLATLKTVIDLRAINGPESTKIAQLAGQYRAQNIPYFQGADFILTYQDPKSANLKEVGR